MAAVRTRFSPEFVNRIDSVITYKPLDRAACEIILDQILAGFARLIHNRLGLGHSACSARPRVAIYCWTAEPAWNSAQES